MKQLKDSVVRQDEFRTQYVTPGGDDYVVDHVTGLSSEVLTPEEEQGLANGLLMLDDIICEDPLEDSEDPREEEARIFDKAASLAVEPCQDCGDPRGDGHTGCPSWEDGPATSTGGNRWI